MATCGELITSEDVYDYIIETNEELQAQANQEPYACIKLVDDTWSIGYGNLPTNLSLSVGQLGYYTIPKLYGLMDTTSLDESGITSTINQPSLNVRGQGVLIGFVDTGIDYLLDSFKFTPTATKISAIWDQTITDPSLGDGQSREQSVGQTPSGTENVTGSTTPGTSPNNTTTDNADNAMAGGSGTGSTDNTGTAGSTGEAGEPIVLPSLQGNENEQKTLKEVLRREFDYGSIYTEEDINNALRSQRNGGDPYQVVPTRDEEGHGTFLAGVAASSQVESYMGAAPDARIAMVKLKPAKNYLRQFYLIKEDAVAYQENDIMLAIRFLQITAANLNLPLVVCIGLGTSSGSRTGSSPLDSYISDLSRQGNTVVVTCVGNEANERAHIRGEAFSDIEPEEVEISVGSGEKGFTMEIWADSLDVLSVSIVSPSGEQIPRIPARIRNSTEYKFLLENTRVTVDYKVAEKTTGFEVVFLRFITPSEGIWKIFIYSLTNIKGGYNAWLPIRQFLSADTYFLNSIPDSTLTGPSDSNRPISIGAYDHITGGIYINSGRGNTPDRRVKPDLVAPGVNVYGPRAGGGFTNRTGTSIAAAHVAGAAALLLTWGVYYQNSPLMGTSEVKSVLIRGATRDQQMTYPNNIWGYGKLNLIKSFLQMRIS